jgi:type II secretory pathway component PulF
MFSSQTAPNLAFASRQLARLLETSDLDTALKKLGGACGPAYARDVERLRALLTSSHSAPQSLGPTPYRTMAKLVPEAGPDRSRFFQDFAEYVRQSSGIYRTWWTGVASVASYLAALCVIAVCIAALFSLYVLPSFAQLFAGFGGELPEFTQNVFWFSRGGLPILAVIALVVVGSVGWFTLLFRRSIQEFAPLPRWLVSAPLIGTLATTYNYGLFVNFARLLLRSGASPARAIGTAAGHSNQRSVTFDDLLANYPPSGEGSGLRELAIAAKLDNLAAEIAFQCDDHTARLADVLVRVRERFAFFAKLIVYWLIACLIVAMYLPIFRMGSTVG